MRAPIDCYIVTSVTRHGLPMSRSPLGVSADVETNPHYVTRLARIVEGHRLAPINFTGSLNCANKSANIADLVEPIVQAVVKRQI